MLCKTNKLQTTIEHYWRLKQSHARTLFKTTKQNAMNAFQYNLLSATATWLLCRFLVNKLDVVEKLVRYLDLSDSITFCTQFQCVAEEEEAPELWWIINECHNFVVATNQKPHFMLNLFACYFMYSLQY